MVRGPRVHRGAPVVVPLERRLEGELDLKTGRGGTSLRVRGAVCGGGEEAKNSARKCVVLTLVEVEATGFHLSVPYMKVLVASADRNAREEQRRIPKSVKARRQRSRLWARMSVAQSLVGECVRSRVLLPCVALNRRVSIRLLHSTASFSGLNDQELRPRKARSTMAVAKSHSSRYARDLRSTCRAFSSWLLGTFKTPRPPLPQHSTVSALFNLHI